MMLTRGAFAAVIQGLSSGAAIAACQPTSRRRRRAVDITRATLPPAAA
jgi:hypothetical protein